MKDRVVLITGSARRVGRLIAAGLDASKFILHYNRSKTSAIALKEELENKGAEAELYQADFTDLDSVRGLFDFTQEKFGRLDVLINSASLFEKIPFDEVKDFESTFHVNLIAPLMSSRHALKLMSNQSSIINICDSSAYYPFRQHPLHSISKAALDYSTKALALELAPKIRVNTLLLGMILPSESFSKEEFDQICNQRILLKRAAKAEEVIQAVEFLITNEYMNASTLCLDGGQV